MRGDTRRLRRADVTGVRIRPARPDELEDVLRLWRHADAVPTKTDDLEGLGVLLARDPGALLVAELTDSGRGDETGGLVGTAICAFDGWRGAVYRLAVLPAARRKGVARLLVEAAAERLDGLGAGRSGAIVHRSDPQAVAFWRSTGWEEQDDWLRFARG